MAFPDPWWILHQMTEQGTRNIAPTDEKAGEEIAPEQLDVAAFEEGLKRMFQALGNPEEWLTNDPQVPSTPPPSLDSIVAAVVGRYHTSDDYNGTLWTSISGMPMDEKRVRALLTQLVDTKKITFRTTGMDVNPGIERLPDSFYDLAKAIQFDKLGRLTLYPTVNEMSSRVVERVDEPFTSMLERGYAQLDFACFELSVLEHYRNDPRYTYKASDVQGAFYPKEKSGLDDKDKVGLDTFGFAYKEGTRAVASFLRYLSRFTPEHQQLWKAKMLNPESFVLHPDFLKMNVMGDWGTHIPVLDAFLMELESINEVCAAIGWKPLFRKTYQNEKPAEFTFLLRPTLAHFNAFVLLLDKMMSDNLNKDFFKDGGIELETETTRKDGKIEVKPKGTIQLLGDWFKKNLNGVTDKNGNDDPTVIPEMVDAFREVRKLRQNPAHKEEPNEFDPKYFRDQKDLINQAYKAVQTIRMLFKSHPKAYAVEVPEVLKEFRIRSF